MIRAPLADRLRPASLDEVVGQRHLLGPGKVLRKIVESGDVPNMIFYGPSGVGKTTVARIIAEKTRKRLHKLNGTNASTADIRQMVGELETLLAPGGILLYLDEIQYFNKKQQQSLLEYMENGQITLIASTTENPWFYVYGAVLSRATVFEFKPVSAAEIEPAVRRAFEFWAAENQVKLEVADETVKHIAAACGGDVRKAVNAAELCALAAEREGDRAAVRPEHAEAVAQRSAMRYDREGDVHYDILSAFQKSLRGSDPDAALHYLARLLEAGDLPSACRRLTVCACEDVGLAYPQIIPIVNACVEAALRVGLPEAVIPLADAVVLVALSPKSNTAYVAYEAAAEDVRKGRFGDIPPHLKDAHWSGAAKLGRGIEYRYPHDFENGYVPQQYLPDELKNAVYYRFGNNKTEQGFKQYWDKIKNR